MKQENKELLLKDLCARLPYEVKVAYCAPDNTEIIPLSLATIKIIEAIPVYTDFPISVKPYLRPMSSMTEEEKEEYRNIDNQSYSCPIDYAHIPASDRIDWLNKKMFDYHGLIPKGLALETPNGMYK